ncbi:MAG: fibronectin type III domain-containing protein [candidate division WOR-3 bacterium]|nr:fibronectin type III domain-containing protein [candidate division WOR-3 bacterium]
MGRFLVVCVFFILMILSCNGAVTIESPQVKNVFMGTNHLMIFWEKNELIENSTDFAGYNVYVYTDSSALLVDDGEELNKFNSQTIQDTTFQANGLLQDRVYFVQVRTVNTENKVNGYNATTPFMRASPRPEFTVTMKIAAESQPVNDSSAVRYSDGLVMADSSMIGSAADMWVKASGDTVWFVSPSGHPLYGSGARQTMLSNIGPGDFNAISGIASEPASEEIEVVAGEIVVAKNEDGNYVKLYIDTIDLQNDVIVILYAYQNIPEFPYF